MDVTIKKGIALGRVKAPPSKSMAHRYLLCGALSNTSEIKGISFSVDVSATLNCLKQLGAQVTVDKNNVILGGLDFEKVPENCKLFCEESGTTLRFLLPIALLCNKEITLCGSERLFERSLSVYEQICTAQNIKFEKTKDSVTVCGKLSPGKYSVQGNISSQFISGLMFALSLIDGDSEINIIGKCESSSYLSLTIKALADFGVRVSRIDENTIYIKGSQKFKNRSLSVEGDYSNAAFLDAFNLFGGNVAVSGLNKNSAQGDRVYKDFFEKLNKCKPCLDVTDCPDLAPILMAVAAAKNGAEFIGTHRLKIKESDRATAMATELAKFGCKVTVNENSVMVSKGIKTPVAPIFSHNDHRIIMAFAVLLTITGGTIIGAQAVAKSFPDFFNKLQDLGIEIEVIN